MIIHCDRGLGSIGDGALGALRVEEWVFGNFFEQAVAERVGNYHRSGVPDLFRLVMVR